MRRFHSIALFGLLFTQMTLAQGLPQAMKDFHKSRLPLPNTEITYSASSSRALSQQEVSELDVVELSPGRLEQLLVLDQYLSQKSGQSHPTPFMKIPDMNSNSFNALPYIYFSNCTMANEDAPCTVYPIVRYKVLKHAGSAFPNVSFTLGGKTYQLSTGLFMPTDQAIELEDFNDELKAEAYTIANKAANGDQTEIQHSKVRTPANNDEGRFYHTVKSFLWWVKEL